MPNMETDIECGHCGGTAVSLTSLGAYGAFGGGYCADCGHPGYVARDAYGAFAWYLTAGRCHDSKCEICAELLLGALQTVVAEERVDVLDLPEAAGLIAQAEDLAIALREKPAMALKRIVTDFNGAAAIAARHFAEQELAN